MNTMESEPMGILDRVKAAGSVLVNGKLPNPLAEEPQDRSRAGLVKELTEWAREERKFWQPIYDRMHTEEEFAAGRQWEDADAEEKYVGDIVQQTVNRLVASLYAKNPTPDAKRLEKMLFSVWDGSQESLRGAQALLTQAAGAIAVGGGNPPLPGPLPQGGEGINPAAVQAAQMVMDDYDRGMAEKKMLETIADTYRLLLKHQWKTHKPDFKVLMKQCVAQAVVSRVGFIQVGYRRDMEQNPAIDGGVSLADKLASLQQKLRELDEAEEGKDSPRRAEVELMQAELGREMQLGGKVSFEGMVYQLVPADCVIVDRNCTCLWEFLGAKRVARQTFMEVSAAEKRWNVSLRDTGAVLYDEKNEARQAGGGDLGRDGAPSNNSGTSEKLRVCVWHVYDKEAGLCYVVCDGLKNFLEEPYCPEPAVERFWPLVPITLNFQVVTRNQPEIDVTIYPRSHVRLMMPMQENINHQGEELRDHIVANRPGWVAVKSKFGENDLAKLNAPRRSHDCALLEDLQPGEKITDYIQPRPVQPIDPKLYDPTPALQASMLATGLSAANLGQQSTDEKATGQAIAEGSRISVDQSNIDGVTFALSVVAQMSFEMLVQEMPEKTVKRIVGPGAKPVQLRKAEVQEEIYLEVEAGSTGRPNEALEVAKLKEIVPLALPMLQALGVPPDVLLKKVFEVLGINVDLDELLAKAQPAMPVMPPMGAGGVEGQMSNVEGQGAGQGPIVPGGQASNVMPANKAPAIPPQQRAQVVRSAVG